MKILFLAPLESTGGHALVSRLLLKHLQNNNEICSIDLSKASDHYGSFSFRRISEVLKVLYRVYLYKGSVDIIYLTISQSFFGNLKDILIYLLLFNKLDKLVIHLHGGSIGEKLFKKFNFLKKINYLCYQKTKNIIISGKSHYRIFPKNFKSRIEIVHNFAPNYMFTNDVKIKSKFYKSKILKILYLGNMFPEKGYLNLLDSLKFIDKSILKNIIFNFAGKFYNSKLEIDFLKRLDFYDNVFFHGEVSDKDKLKLFQESHVFCIPTQFLEGQPISILEAYASGAFVLSTNSPGISDIFENNENGFSIGNGEPESISIKIEQIYRNLSYCEKIVLQNYENCLKKYKQEKYFEKLEKIFES